MGDTRKESVIVLIFVALFLFSIMMLFNSGMRTTGYAVSANTTSNVTISSFFAVEMSINLSNGIQFGDVSSLPSTDLNATHNYDGANTTAQGAAAGNGTSMWMNVSTDSNTAVDFCIKADALNTSQDDEIGLGNETYHNSTFTNISSPTVGSQVSMTTSYVSAGENIAAGNNNYYRFWLDVPVATPTGTYNNTVSFKGIVTGGAC